MALILLSVDNARARFTMSSGFNLPPLTMDNDFSAFNPLIGRSFPSLPALVAAVRDVLTADMRIAGMEALVYYSLLGERYSLHITAQVTTAIRHHPSKAT